MLLADHYRFSHLPLKFFFLMLLASSPCYYHLPRFVPISPNWRSFHRNFPKNVISPVYFWETPKTEKPEKHWYHGVFRLPSFSQIHVFPKVLCSGARSLSLLGAKSLSLVPHFKSCFKSNFLPSMLLHFPPPFPLRPPTPTRFPIWESSWIHRGNHRSSIVVPDAVPMTVPSPITCCGSLFLNPLQWAGTPGITVF